MLLPTIVILLLTALAPSAFAGPAELLKELDSFPHATRVSYQVEDVIDYEIGLGAMRKVRGSWSFKDSERQSGELTRYTWQIIDGFTSNEVLEQLEGGLQAQRLLFGCEGRSCGQGVQWANRVFRERVLYGRDDLQRYRVFGPAEQEAEAYRVLLFSSSRTADRQYLHAEFLKIEN
jgi:Domain of unknown function (DUF4892)